MPMPFLTGLFDLLIHVKGACLCLAADGKLHGHNGKTEKKQEDDVQQNKSAAAELSAHPREFPHVAAAYGAAGRQENKSESASEFFS